MKKYLIYTFLVVLINLVLKQSANAQQVLGDFTNGNTFEWPRLTWLRDLDNNWDEGLIKMAPNTGGIARAGFGIHMNATRQFTFWSSGFNPLLSIEGGTGNTFIKGKLGLGYIDPDAPLGILATDAVIRMVAKDVKSFDIGTHADGVFTIGDYGQRILNINYAENVGIGTLNPGGKLEIQQQSSGWTTVSRVNAITPGEINGFKFYSGYIGEDKWSGIASVAEEMHSNKTGLSIYTNQSEKLRVTADGRVGIGSTLPESKLRVVGGGVVIGRNATANDTDGNLSIGDISMNSNPNTTTWWYGTNMLISGLDFTSIGFHDAGERVDFIRSGKGTIELGYDGGWGHANIALPNGIWNAAGNLGIGTTAPTERLTVNGKIRANEIKVDGAGTPDYVFEEGYKVGTLAEVESYIKANKHLPEVPSAKEMERDGMALGDMNRLLLKKIEELTLHLIEKDKSIIILETKNIQFIENQKSFVGTLEQLTKRIESLEKQNQK
jgi:hypothetical protein